MLIDFLLNLNQNGASFGATGTKSHLTFESMKEELIFKRKISLCLKSPPDIWLTVICVIMKSRKILELCFLALGC
jgi:hypothetical protein